MAARVLSVPFGEPATRALAEVVAELRGGDPLAPVTVTVPSAAAGVTLRRCLAGEQGGLVGVTFQSLPQLAARLAAPVLDGGNRRPLPAVVLRGHLRAALRRAAAGGGPLAQAAASAATERALEATVAELADLDEGALAALAARGGVTAAAVAVAVDVRRRASAAGSADRGEVLLAAVEAVGAGTAPLAAVGPVVVHLPRRLRPVEARLVAALGATVLVGRTGDPAGDEPHDALLAALGATAGTATVELRGGDAVVPVVDELVRAPDPAEEAAVAARLVLDAVAVGTTPERIAVRYRVREPYAALLHEQLDAAGIAHHAPSVGTLAHAVAGRVLLGALGLSGAGWRRAEVAAWWRSGPVRDLVTGTRVPVSWWDRLARQAGVVCGLDQWRQRLDQAAEHRRRWVEPEALDDDRRLQGYARLAAAVEALAARLDDPPTGSWSAWSAWAGALLDDVLGPPSAAEHWPEEERDARAAVAEAVAGLGRLDGVDDPPDAHRARQALERELERPARPHGRFGHGVAVGPLVDGVGADADLVVVVGAAEGAFPPRGSDDALVPDRERRAAGGQLAPRARTRGEEARDLLAALAGGRRRVLVAPRSDPRAQRERQPAPAFLDAAGRRAGGLVATADLDGLRGRTPWFTDVESFEWWPAGGRPERTLADLDVAARLAGHPPDDPALARGLEAAAARRRGEFDAWSGNVGTRGDLLDGFDRPRSPTSLEQYATCPFRFFLGQVLGVEPLDDPTDADELSARDAGSLVHAVLERFIGERGLGRAPDEPWSPDDRRRLLEIADDVADEVVAEGRAGRPLLWDVRREQLRRQLLAVLDEDEHLRRTWRSTPVAVEHAFGITDEPVVVEIGGRAVAFKGVIDRIDRTADGGLLVVDYKTGSDTSYKGLDDDITGRGRRLQLGIYALAARRDHPAEGAVDARYWFAGRGGEPALVGRRFDDDAEARFHEVVGTVLDGVVAGRFPANPGDERWDRGRYLHDHCKYCEFERVCPTTRGWRWQQARALPELAAYVALAEGDE